MASTGYGDNPFKKQEARPAQMTSTTYGNQWQHQDSSEGPQDPNDLEQGYRKNKMKNLLMKVTPDAMHDTHSSQFSFDNFVNNLKSTPAANMRRLNDFDSKMKKLDSVSDMKARKGR
jgi:hypothetical protein